METEPENLVYAFTQNVTRVEREEEAKPGAHDEYTRRGLLLVTSRRTLTDWVRTVREYECDAKFLEELRGRVHVPREELTAEDRRLRATHKLGVGLQMEEQLFSGPLGDDTGLLAGPIPFDSVALPTVAPRLEPGVPEVGKHWTGAVRLKYGFGEFKAGYSARLAALTPKGPRIDVTLNGKEPWAMGENVLLLMKPTGSWAVVLNVANQCPMRSQGRFEIGVRTQWQENGRTRTFEVGRCNCAFTYERVPVSFDEEKVYSAAWAEAERRGVRMAGDEIKPDPPPP